MKIKVNNTFINIRTNQNKSLKNNHPILLLHGFTGSSEDWCFFMDEIDERFYPIAIDLPGHGKTQITNNLNEYSSDFILIIINSIIKEFHLDKVVLLGYSMGGRVAQSFTIKNLSKVKAIILESTTPGIENPREIENRYQADMELAKFIEEEGVDKFIKYWMDLPLFESLKSVPVVEYQKIIKTKLKSNPNGLANSLRGFSTGSMKSMWNSLSKIDHPTLLVSGELDKKYCDISVEMKKNLANAEHQIVPKAGHNVHLEKPKEFVKLVNNFITNLT